MGWADATTSSPRRKSAARCSGPRRSVETRQAAAAAAAAGVPGVALRPPQRRRRTAPPPRRQTPPPAELATCAGRRGAGRGTRSPRCAGGLPARPAAATTSSQRCWTRSAMSNCRTAPCISRASTRAAQTRFLLLCTAARTSTVEPWRPIAADHHWAPARSASEPSRASCWLRDRRDPDWGTTQRGPSG